MPRKIFNPSNEGYRQQLEEPEERQPELHSSLTKKEKDFDFMGEALTRAMDKEIKYVLWVSAALTVAGLCYILTY